MTQHAGRQQCEAAAESRRNRRRMDRRERERDLQKLNYKNIL